MGATCLRPVESNDGVVDRYHQSQKVPEPRGVDRQTHMMRPLYDDIRCIKFPLKQIVFTDTCWCVCSVQFVDLQKFYLPLDTSLLLDMIKTDIQYLGASWKMMGRPLMVIPIRKSLLGL